MNSWSCAIIMLATFGNRQIKRRGDCNRCSLSWASEIGGSVSGRQGGVPPTESIWLGFISPGFRLLNVPTTGCYGLESHVAIVHKLIILPTGGWNDYVRGDQTRRYHRRHSRLRSSHKTSTLGLLMALLPGVVGQIDWSFSESALSVNCKYCWLLAFVSLLLCGLALWVLSLAIQDLKRSIKRCKAQFAKLAENRRS